MVYDVYSRDYPDILGELAATPPLLRLRDVGMHCSLEYTSFPAYRDLPAYSRLMHSVGVGRIVWHFTKDPAQAAAGLLHDVATPAFAHVVDFLRGDHMAQESTEADTEAVIAASPEIRRILERHKLTVPQVSDYHIYPVADNPSPRLSADRLEYSLGNMHLVQRRPLSEIAALYGDIALGEDESGAPELAFSHLEEAERFALLALVNARWYVSDEDRFAMQRLADLLRHATELGVLSENDLYATESAVIDKLLLCPETAGPWADYRRMDRLERLPARPEGRYAVNIPAKRRYIDPLVVTSREPVRVSALSPVVREGIRDFLSDDFDRWLCLPEE